jgi:hypothetical protein
MNDQLDLANEVLDKQTPFGVALLLRSGYTPDEAWAEYRRIAGESKKKQEVVTQVVDPITPQPNQLTTNPYITSEEMTVAAYFERETGRIADYLGCNKGELISEMNQLFNKCLDLMSEK